MERPPVPRAVRGRCAVAAEHRGPGASRVLSVRLRWLRSLTEEPTEPKGPTGPNGPYRTLHLYSAGKRANTQEHHP
ncbi:hypothetical protein GCM10012285_18810 [Streptomyces kronopolitis]|uniref:Uncharacterized protein n=1 Tax=Streptomyces kronopolitis TaxID=1612435 RepID=A0ABQ2J9J4_9ACTN|nr:hypothetical protein GCM10012285_18810 [Streptomyces kronopolitis]